MNKKTTKNVKPAFIVDLTEAEDSADVMYAFANARFEAGIPLEQRDYDIIVAVSTNTAIEMVSDLAKGIFEFETIMLGEVCKKCLLAKKEPWYKRLWNWIKKPFCKK